MSEKQWLPAMLALANSLPQKQDTDFENALKALLAFKSSDATAIKKLDWSSIDHADVFLLAVQSLKTPQLLQTGFDWSTELTLNEKKTSALALMLDSQKIERYLDVTTRYPSNGADFQIRKFWDKAFSLSCFSVNKTVVHNDKEITLLDLAVLKCAPELERFLVNHTWTQDEATTTWAYWFETLNRNAYGSEASQNILIKAFDSLPLPQLDLGASISYTADKENSFSGEEQRSERSLLFRMIDCISMHLKAKLKNQRERDFMQKSKGVELAVDDFVFDLWEKMIVLIKEQPECVSEFANVMMDQNFSDKNVFKIMLDVLFEGLTLEERINCTDILVNRFDELNTQKGCINYWKVLPNNGKMGAYFSPSALQKLLEHANVSELKKEALSYVCVAFEHNTDELSAQRLNELKTIAETLPNGRENVFGKNTSPTTDVENKRLMIAGLIQQFSRSDVPSAKRKI